MYVYPSYLRRVMEERGLTVAAVSKLTRRRAETVEDWLAGAKPIPTWILSRIAEPTSSPAVVRLPANPAG